MADRKSIANEGSEAVSTITLTRNQLADICYSAAVQGRDTIFVPAPNVGAELNRMAEGIADSVFANPAHWQAPSLRDLSLNGDGK